MSADTPCIRIWSEVYNGGYPLEFLPRLVSGEGKRAIYALSENKSKHPALFENGFPTVGRLRLFIDVGIRSFGSTQRFKNK